MTKPYAESCDQNKDVIFNVIFDLLKDKRKLLEIGSGTGQHAIYFAAQLPELKWQTSDRKLNHDGIQQWIDEAKLENVINPVELDVSQGNWPKEKFDAVYSANTAHIMSHDEVRRMFSGVGRILEKRGVFLLYGPFNYNGGYTSESNARFDIWLKSRNVNSCIKHYEQLAELAREAGMVLQKDFEMPENNRILFWRKD